MAPLQEYLIPRPPQFFKIKFDGASKGNLNPLGVGGVFRDDRGMVKGMNIVAQLGLNNTII
jgi:hypothetical protein